mmetsp:Transcript_10868/g.24078  ORF Transcript_10868/g.24078 Transcript_10868/m.24078 type:complete len:325 (+) Transcript_10868:116-1090(+)|eukprot:CAMPEP_0173187152 /NCGR_PEP_ID=MMETSP1141-20130122/10536_1 /TAXON_ID=483371 /ORGANISM="non described non described, Strain CCMP2298" /LENGTH=324 /DNA_ID=CAMNT_0014110929 /DNA_START=92 /DNA_END=1066 /DNA_ORIENTATION=+
MSCPVNERLVHVALFVAAAAFYRQVLRNSSKPTHSKSEHRPLDQVHIGLIAAENEISMPGSPGMRQVSPERPLRKSIGSPPATPQRNDDTSFHFLTPISSSICLAEPLVRRIDQSSGQIIVIGIAGGSGSGKTTLARAIYESIGEDNITFLSHDSYYRDLTHLAEEERAKQNFDHPDSLETSLLVQHIIALKNGNRIAVPTYDYTTHTRVPGTMLLSARCVVLVEGILIFSHKELYDLMDIKIFVDTDDDIRLIRRIQRDVQERGRTLMGIINQYMGTVRPMHEQFVEPSKRNADIIVPVGLNSVALDLIISKLKSHLAEVAVL